MKSKHFILILIALANFIFKSNSQPIPNGGFENWDTTGKFEDPTGYSTSNFHVYTQSGQGNVNKQSPPYSGKYSVWLETVNVWIVKTKIGYMMLGKPGSFFATGKVQDITGGFPCSQLPDSFIFHARHQCINGDTAYVIVILKKNVNGKSESVSYNTFKIIGIQNNYCRYSIPVIKPSIPVTPDTAIICFTSSNPYYADSLNSGNWLEIDSISFKNNTGTAVAIPNYDFENWDVNAGVEPPGWLTFNFIDQVFMLQEQSTTAVSPGHSGNYAIKIKSNQYNNTMPTDTFGNISLGDRNTGKTGLKLLKNPDSLSFWYKYNNDKNINDTASIFLSFSKSDSILNQKVILYDKRTPLKKASNYTHTNISFKNCLNKTADTIDIMFSSSKLNPTGRGVGNYLIIDDLLLWYDNVGIPILNQPGKESFIYPNPANDYINVTFDLNASSNIYITIADLNGRMLKTQYFSLKSGKQLIKIDLQHIPSGQYLLFVKQSKNLIFSRNLFINK